MSPNVGDDSEEIKMVLDLGEPPEDVLEFARLELGETADVRACTVQELRDIVYERGDVVPHRMDDVYLVRFLRARYFNVEKAYQLLIKYYKFKEDYPWINNGVAYLSDEMQYISNAEIISVLPYRDQNGRRTMIYRMGNWDTSVCTIEDIFRSTLLLLELAILEQRAQILGGVCFFDLENLSLQQAWQMTPDVAFKVVQLMGASFPIRLSAIHILNQPWVFDMVFAVFKPLLNERTRTLIHFHGSNYETLHQHVDPKHLPECYGGTRRAFKNSDSIQAMDTNKDIVNEMQGLGYVCDLRVLKKDGEEGAPKDLQETKESTTIKQN